MLNGITIVKRFGAQLLSVPIRNALRSSGLVPHLAPTNPVTTPNAADLATTVALANAMKAAYNAHIASTVVHVTADSTNAVTSADATDQATSNTLLNELKGDLNAHLVLAAAHGVVGGAGSFAPATVTTADATDGATSVTLANALKGAVNRHFAAGIKLP